MLRIIYVLEKADEKPKRSNPNADPESRCSRTQRRREAECLTSKIAKKAARGCESKEEDLHCYLEHRFERPLVKYGCRGPFYSHAFTLLSATVVAAGFGSSAISAVNDSQTASEALRWIAIGLGVLISVFTAINQLWKPDLRSVGSYRAGNALRREGWDFVFGRGSYRSAEADQAFEAFLDRVKEIQMQVDAIDEVQAESISGPEDGKVKPIGETTKPEGSSASGWRAWLGR